MPSARETRIFVCYCSEDRVFVDRLQAAVARHALNFDLDTADTLPETYAAIDSADVFVALVSPAAMASEMCQLQIAHASQRGKRLVPVICHEVAVESVPAELASLNWVFVYDDDSADNSFDSVINAINLDLEWLHAHTRLLGRALEWQRSGGQSSLLLRGRDLREVEETLRRNEGAQPGISAIQLAYVQASSQAAAISRCWRRAAMATLGVGVVWAVGFVPIAIHLVQQVAPDSAALQLTGDVLVPPFVGAVAACIFATTGFGALLLEERLGAASVWRTLAPMLASAPGSVMLGTAAGFEVLLGLYGPAIPIDLPFGIEAALLLTAGLVTAILESLVLDGMVLGVRNARLGHSARRLSAFVVVISGIGATAGAAGVLVVWGHPADLLSASVISAALVLGFAAMTQRNTYRAARATQSDVAEANLEIQVRRATRVFISYSRRDTAYVRRLHAALVEHGLQVWVDWEGIPLTADYLQEIYTAIDASDAFVFVASPDSAASEICGLEAAHAAEHHKRLVPVIHRVIGTEAMPEPLQGIAAVELLDTTDVAHLCEVISRDIDWVHLHTGLLTRAIEWQRKLRHDSFLLAGRALGDAEKAFMAARHLACEPRATHLQMQYLRRSWRAAIEREAQSRTWLISLGFGVVCAGLQAMPLARLQNFSSGAIVFLVVAAVVGAATCEALLAGALALERRRDVEQLARERRWPVAMVVAVATIAGCASLLAIGLYASGEPGLQDLVQRPLGTIVASGVASAAAVSIVGLLLLPFRRTGPFHTPDDTSGLLQRRRRGSLARLGCVLLALGVLELGWVALSHLIAPVALLAAFGVVGSCIGVAALLEVRLRGGHTAVLAARLASVVTGGVYGVGGCAVVLPPVSLLIVVPAFLNILATLLAAALAAGTLLVLEPRARLR